MTEGETAQSEHCSVLVYCRKYLVKFLGKICGGGRVGGKINISNIVRVPLVYDIPCTLAAFSTQVLDPRC